MGDVRILAVAAAPLEKITFGLRPAESICTGGGDPVYGDEQEMKNSACMA